MHIVELFYYCLGLRYIFYYQIQNLEELFCILMLVLFTSSALDGGLGIKPPIGLCYINSENPNRTRILYKLLHDGFIKSCEGLQNIPYYK